MLVKRIKISFLLAAHLVVLGSVGATEIWKDVDLRFSDLEDELKPDVCAKSERAFLACVFALLKTIEFSDTYFDLTVPEDFLLSPRVIRRPVAGLPEIGIEKLRELYPEIKKKILSGDHRFPAGLLSLLRGSGKSESEVAAGGLNAFFQSYYDRYTRILPRKLFFDQVNEKKGCVPSSPATQPSVEYKSFGGHNNMGYISIAKFRKNSCEKVALSLAELFKKPLSGLIIDLRSNSGGILEEATCVAGLFLKPGNPIATEQEIASGKEKHHFAGRQWKSISAVLDEDQKLELSQAAVQVKLLLLMNGESASSAEILAGALKENHRASLIGERTFGKCTVQEVQPWKNKKDILYIHTVGRYRFPSGSCSDGIGIEPDYFIPKKVDSLSPLRSPLSLLSADSQLAAAMGLIDSD